MSTAKRRRHFTGQEKVAIPRRHLIDTLPVSDLCEEHGVHSTLFYRWQRDWFEQGAVAFDAPLSRIGAAKRTEDAGGPGGSGLLRTSCGVRTRCALS